MQNVCQKGYGFSSGCARESVECQKLPEFGIMGLQGKYLGLWDDTLFEIGITEISFEIGIMDIKSNQKVIFHPCKIDITGLHPFPNWDYRITLALKLGLRDYRTPPYGRPRVACALDTNTTRLCLYFLIHYTTHYTLCL